MKNGHNLSFLNGPPRHSHKEWGKGGCMPFGQPDLDFLNTRGLIEATFEKHIWNRAPPLNTSPIYGPLKESFNSYMSTKQKSCRKWFIRANIGELVIEFFPPLLKTQIHLSAFGKHLVKEFGLPRRKMCENVDFFRMCDWRSFVFSTKMECALANDSFNKKNAGNACRKLKMSRMFWKLKIYAVHIFPAPGSNNTCYPKEVKWK